MRPAAAIASAYRRSFDYSGRSTRSEFWWFAAYEILAMILLQFLDGAIFDATIFSREGEFTPISELFALANLLPRLSLTIRRLRDAGIRGAAVTAFVVGTSAASYALLVVALARFGTAFTPAGTGYWLETGLFLCSLIIWAGAVLPSRGGRVTPLAPYGGILR